MNYIGWPIPAFGSPPESGGVRGGLNRRLCVLHGNPWFLVQVKCKANAEPSSLELCWAAAFTRNASLKCIAKVQKFSMQNKPFSDLFQIYFDLKFWNLWISATYKSKSARNRTENDSLIVQQNSIIIALQQIELFTNLLTFCRNLTLDPKGRMLPTGRKNSTALSIRICNPL